MNKDDIQPPGHKADFAIVKVIRSKRMIVVDTHIDHATIFGVLGPLTLHGDNVSGPVRFGHDGKYVRILIEVMGIMDFDEALAFVQEKQNASVAEFKDLGEHFDRNLPLKELVRRVVIWVERDALLGALQRTGGNKAKAARLLQIDYKTIHKKIREYSISCK